MQNGTYEQKVKYLPDACSGKTIGGMGKDETVTPSVDVPSMITLFLAE